MKVNQKLYALFFSLNPQNRLLALELAKGADLYDSFINELYQEFSKVPLFENTMKTFVETWALSNGDEDLDEVAIRGEQIKWVAEMYFDENLILSPHYPIETEHLRAFPDILLHFNFLTRLDLIGNNITHLPQDMSGLSGLKMLTLQDCPQLAEAPYQWQGLRHLSNLETLVLEDIDLIEIPDYFKSFTRLRELAIDNTFLDTLPNWIHELSCLESVEIGTTGWRETMYPPYFEFPENFSLLPRLRELIVSPHYEVWKFPHIGRLTQLRKLVLSGVACRCWDGITQLKQLEYLDLSHFSLDYPLTYQGQSYKDPPDRISRLQLYGWEWLQEMTWLKEFHFVHIEPYAFTELEKEALAEALPQCKFTYQ